MMRNTRPWILRRGIPLAALFVCGVWLRWQDEGRRPTVESSVREIPSNEEAADELRIQVVDDANGHGLPGVVIQVDSPGSRVRQVTTDAAGWVAWRAFFLADGLFHFRFSSAGYQTFEVCVSGRQIGDLRTIRLIAEPVSDGVSLHIHDRSPMSESVSVASRWLSEGVPGEIRSQRTDQVFTCEMPAGEVFVLGPLGRRTYGRVEWLETKAGRATRLSRLDWQRRADGVVLFGGRVTAGDGKNYSLDWSVLDDEWRMMEVSAGEPRLMTGPARIHERWMSGDLFPPLIQIPVFVDSSGRSNFGLRELVVTERRHFALAEQGGEFVRLDIVDRQRAPKDSTTRRRRP